MRFVRTLLVWPLAAVLFCAVGCGDSGSKANPTASAAGKGVSEPAVELNVAAVLIQFRGCEKAPNVTRTRVEALKFAEDIARKAKAGEDFYELAKKHSDGPRAASGGMFGNFSSANMLKQVVDTTMGMKVGEISEPVETHFGYYVIVRREVEEIFNASHILLLHEDSQPKLPGVKRTKAEAMALAKELVRKVEAGGNFNQLALTFSNGPGQKVGGQLGNFTIAELPAYFGQVGKMVETLEIDQISEPFETEVGVHLVKRQAIPKPASWLAAKHVLVMYEGAERSGGITRSREEALARITRVQGKLMAGEKFEELAEEYSDCPSAAQGGDLGGDRRRFRSDSMTPVFSKAVTECTVGGYTDIIETEFGFHIIYRYAVTL